MQLSRTPRGRSTSNRRKKKHPSFHIVLIGDTGVGKTSLLTQYSDNTYRDHHITTIGLDFKIAKTTLDGKQYNLMIWDTAGQERFKTITPSFYRKASGMLLMYDVTDKESFQNCVTWMADIEESNPEGRHIHIVLVGCKTDCSDSERQVSGVDGQRFADMFGLSFIETSAKNNVNVVETFDAVTRLIVQEIVDGEIKEGEEKETVKLGVRRRSVRGGEGGTRSRGTQGTVVELAHPRESPRTKLLGCC